MKFLLGGSCISPEKTIAYKAKILPYDPFDFDKLIEFEAGRIMFEKCLKTS